jgi:hypothetical protein
VELFMGVGAVAGWGRLDEVLQLMSRLQLHSIVMGFSVMIKNENSIS